MKHTPLPWHAVTDTVHDPEGGQVADCSTRSRGIANARLIVAAVNAYQPLREALTLCKAVLGAKDGPTAAERDGAIALARAALALTAKEPDRA